MKLLRLLLCLSVLINALAAHCGDLSESKPENIASDSLSCPRPVYEWKMFPRFAFDVTMGAAISLQRGPVADFSPDPAVFEMDLRAALYFHRYLGIYAALGFTHCNNPAPWNDPDGGEYDDFLCGFWSGGRMSVGLTAMFNVGRFELFPRLGFGRGGDYAFDRDSYVVISENDGYGNVELDKSEVQWHYENQIMSNYVDIGCGGVFRISKNFGILLDLEYRYPLEYCTMTTYKVSNKEETFRSYRSKAWYNELSVGIGFRLMLRNPRVVSPRSESM